MLSDNQQNLSIELEQQPSNIDQISMAKCDDQLTQELYQIARKIAESDRNNDVYRQTKKNKANQLQILKRSQLDKELEYQQILIRMDSKRKQLGKFGSYICQQAQDKTQQKLCTPKKFKKINQFQHRYYTKNKGQLEQLSNQVGILQQTQKQLHQTNIQKNKQNQKLQRKISGLQIEYQILIKQNKHKTAMLNKLKKQKQQKNQKYHKNQIKIAQLEDKCQNSKNHAEQLENQLKEELRIQSQLEEIIKQRQLDLEIRNKQKQETQRKKQQSKRTVNKLANSVRAIQAQIQQKLKQADKIQAIHNNLKSKVLQMQTKQRKLDQIMNRRRSIIQNLKNASEELVQQKKKIQDIRKIQNDSSFDQQYH